MKILIINGPNLNLLGEREPDIYGSRSFEDYFRDLQHQYPEVILRYYHSNVEGEIINRMHQARNEEDAIILNAGGYTHTSVAIGDAIKAIHIPVVEVHISNVLGREDFRRQSMISAGVKGVISGFGLDSYRLAMLSLI